MGGGFASLGRFVYRRRRAVVAGWLVAVVAALPLAPRLQGALASGGFIAQDSEAVHAGDELHRLIPARPRAELVVVSPGGDAAALRAAIAPLRGFPHVIAPGGLPAVRHAPDGRLVYAVFPLDVDPDTAKGLVDRFRARVEPQPGARVYVTGAPAVYADIESATAHDLRRAEAVGVPAALVVLVLAFGTAVAAAIPLLVGGIAVLTTLAVLLGVAQLFPLSIFVLNIATMLGLGVGVDYALLAVSRFREELRAGRDVAAAVERTVATAGRAIGFSGVAVLVGLSGLWAFGLRVLSSVAIGGSLVVGCSVLAALTLLPALLGMVGGRIERAPVLPRRLRGGGGGWWELIARSVMRRPWPFILVTVGIVAVLAAPAATAVLNVPRSEVLPTRYDSRVGEQLLDRHVPESRLYPIVLVVRDLAALRALEARAAAVPGVAGVVGPGDVPAGRRALYESPRGAAVEVYPRASPFSDGAREVVSRLRALPGHGTAFEVTGQTAGERDFLAQIEDRAPWAVGFIFLVTYGVLFAAFRSAFLPLKAIVMNSMSILGSFGVLVWVFQDGHLGGPLNVQPLGYIEATMPVVIFCTLFGISMDYEVFMLSRIAERHRAGASTADAVAGGLVATARIITSAAAIVVVIGLAFAVTDVVVVKEIGLGLALAIFLDATLIRTLLVPATMRVLGDWNWWPAGRRARVAASVCPPAEAPVPYAPGAGRPTAHGRARSPDR